MTDVLNLALKKDVFEGLKNGMTNVITIEKTNWWKKRLMDVDTGRFKPFKSVVATCGNADRFSYDIKNIVLDGDTFYITVENPVMDITPETVNPEQINPEVIEQEETVEKKTYIKPEVFETIVEEVKEETREKMEEDREVDIDTDMPGHLEKIPEQEEQNEEPAEVAEPKEEKKDVQEVIMHFINGYCKGDNVFVVNMPRVTIRNNGRIMGCTKRLLADRERDVLFEFNKKEFVKHPEELDSRFMMTIVNYLTGISKNNYVFINRRACSFRKDKYGNITFTIYVTAKRKYFFMNR